MTERDQLTDQCAQVEATTAEQPDPPRVLYVLQRDGFRVATQAECEERARWATPDDDPPGAIRLRLLDDDGNASDVQPYRTIR